MCSDPLQERFYKGNVVMCSRQCCENYLAISHDDKAWLHYSHNGIVPM